MMKTIHVPVSKKLKLLMLFFPFLLNAVSVADLSLEEKVGQLLMVHVKGQAVTQETEDLIKESCIGGVIYYTWANELKDPAQIFQLSTDLQKSASQTSHAVPLLIAIDQEGGKVTRLNKGFTIFPGNYALGRAERVDWAEESACLVGEELKRVGIYLNLAPVVDVYTNAYNPVIGIRSFHSSPEKVAKWGSYALQGYKKAGIIAALKHFPGHGDTKVDSHQALPVILKNRALLDEQELLPFRLLAPEAEVIMTGHLLVPALDADQCVTFSRKIVHDLLRQEFNFQGVIMTDSLAMNGVLSQCSSVEEAALKSFKAGHDIILLGGKQLFAHKEGLEFTPQDIKRIHEFLVHSIKQDPALEKQLDESVIRLLALKRKYPLFSFPKESLEKQNHFSDSHLLAKKIAAQALKIIKKKSDYSFQAASYLIIAPDCLQEALEQTDWSFLPHSQIFYFKGLDPDKEMSEKIQKLALTKEKCVYFAYNTWQFESQQSLFQSLLKTSSMVAICVCNPIDQEFLIKSDAVICTFSPAACSLQAAFDCLN